MRLTLRTLLCWIDGVLTPDELHHIGGMVSGSRVATHLAERIREGAACGSTDVPLTGGSAIADDPNRVAEYLDNTLPSEHLEEFERLCIESRTHLTEVAACHRMLADVFRFPKIAKIPREQRPIVRQRIQKLMEVRAATVDTPCDPPPEPAPPAAVPAVTQPAVVDARGAAGALVEAFLLPPPRPLPTRPLPPPPISAVRNEREASWAGLLPSWPPTGGAAMSTPAEVGAAATAAAGERGVSPPAAAAEPGNGAAAPWTGTAARFPAWTAWVTAALGLAVLLAAGGALVSPLRGPKVYKPEPGCMHCTRP